MVVLYAMVKIGSAGTPCARERDKQDYVHTTISTATSCVQVGLEFGLVVGSSHGTVWYGMVGVWYDTGPAPHVRTYR